MQLSRGDAVRVEMTKWDGTPHRTMDTRYLGRDEAGAWLGFTTGIDKVGLVPAAGTPLGPGWFASFHGPGGLVRTYVDMTTVPEWDGATLHAIDLDLDVVEALDGTVYVDDEDEFEEHRRRFGYPSDVVDLAVTARDSVRTALTGRLPPFDGTHLAWLAGLPARGSA